MKISCVQTAQGPEAKGKGLSVVEIVSDKEKLKCVGVEALIVSANDSLRKKKL